MLKALVAPPGSRPRQVRFGIYRGLLLEIDLTNQMQLYLGLQERETHRFIRQALQRCDWFVDVGAGTGELSCLALRHSAAKRVCACEPGHSERTALMRNLELNNFRDDARLVVVDKFVGSAREPGYAPLDSLPHDNRARGFVKIDVDGAEIDVLHSGNRMLSDAPVDILLETHSADLERESRAFLAGKGFSCTVIENAAWRAIVPERRPIGHNRWLWATRN
jgi:hypothetical protein